MMDEEQVKVEHVGIKYQKSNREKALTPKQGKSWCWRHIMREVICMSGANVKIDRLVMCRFIDLGQ